MSEVIELRGRRGYHPDLTTIACRRMADARRRSGLTVDDFADALSDSLDWDVTPQTVRAWETTTSPPGDVLLAADLAAGAKPPDVGTDDLLSSPGPSLLADTLAGMWLTTYQFTPGRDSGPSVKVHVDIAHVAAAPSGRHIIARNYPPDPRTESRAVPFRNEIRAELVTRHLVGQWKNTSDARYFGSLHLAALPGETVMDGYYTGLASDVEVIFGRWRWIRLDLGDEPVDLGAVTLRDPQDLHAIVMNHTRYDRPLSLAAVMEGA